MGSSGDGGEVRMGDNITTNAGVGKQTPVLQNIVRQLDDGATYQGETRDGTTRHGYGIYTYPDGKTFFEGHWRDGKAHGTGTFRDAESEHGGEWQDDFKHGSGQERWFNDGSSYIGNYKFGKKEDLGKYSWADGSYYEGNFSQDNIEGQGAYFSHACAFRGAFKDNVKHGYGRYEWSDGRVYEGQFDTDLKHGDGTMTWPDGYSYKGQWREGVQHGKGIIRAPAGTEEACTFDRGRQVPIPAS